MEYFVNCNAATLSPYTTPLDRDKAEHLYRRLGFSASVQTINAAIGQTSGTLVDALITEAINLPETAAPTWFDWNEDDYPEDNQQRNQIIGEQRREWRLAYANDMLSGNLRDRLSFFWSNHFVTELEVYQCNSFLYYYINCLQRNAIGNFKTFVSEIGLTSAMLYYLDGVFNNGNNPNENYARELYELFTLGEGNNYTEEDIIETAKALSGYVERTEIGCSPVTFNPERHDDGPKSIFGQTGNWGYDDTIDILFQQRPDDISWFICKKLYEFFVHPDSEDAENNGTAKQVIDELAATFRANNFDIAPVLSQLFKSEHFFDDEAIGVIIKSPFDVFMNIVKETNFTVDDNIVNTIINSSRLSGQEIFDPPGVEGWYRDRDWINTNFMISRWLSSEMLLGLFWGNNPEQFRTFAIEATGSTGNTTSDPDEITRAILNKLFPKGIAPDQLQNAYDVFRDDALVQYYAEGDGSWNLMWDGADFQVYQLLLFAIRQPEFQLK